MQKKYYKIITEKAYFRRIYDINDISAVPAGTKIIASAPFGIRCKNAPNIDQPVTHFCDNAFDTMLWHNMFEALHRDSDTQMPPVIYEITPITDVIKEKCPDKLELYQCGAHIIEFKKKVSIKEMFERAVAEFKQNPDKKTKLYPKLPLQKFVNSWANYSQPVIIK